MAHPGGRPTDYRVEHCETVKNLMKEGASHVEIAFELDICLKTLDNWKKEHPEFLQAFNEAINFSEGWWTKKGRKNLENKDFNSRLWEINMMNRFGWMKKSQANHDVEVSDTTRKVREAEDQYK